MKKDRTLNHFRMSALLAIAALLFASIPGRTKPKSQLAPAAGPIPPTFFGMHIHNAGTSTPWPSVPIDAWRLWDARVAWPQLEPNRGQWNFALLDRYISLAEAHRTDVLLPLGMSPHWASARPQEHSVYQPGNAAEPANMSDWQNYVTAVVTRYRGRIRAYEIWNEPNSKEFWTGTTAQMVQLTQIASETIHKIDPSAVVVSPAATTTAGLPWLTEFLAYGGGGYVDVIGYHFYVSPQPPEMMVALIQQVRQTMRNAGLGNKQLWNTESGWPAPKPFPNQQLAAAYLARAFILNWAAGVSRFYWYAWDNHSFVSLQTTEVDSSTLTPAGQALGVVERWVAGTQINSCAEEPDHTWVCQLTKNGVPQWILWNTAGNVAEQRTYLFPQAWSDKSVTPLLGAPQPLNGAAIEVSQIPELVTATPAP